jgi:hypothetical protein
MLASLQSRDRALNHLAPPQQVVQTLNLSRIITPRRQ